MQRSKLDSNIIEESIAIQAIELLKIPILKNKPDQPMELEIEGEEEY
jgi:hypothetical protein